MLVEFTPGLNFINVLRTTFAQADPKKCKKKETNDLTVFFTLSGSTCAKAARIMLVKLTPGVNPIKQF